ncbi:MAG: M56 family metallopeptidase [Actinomycetota bacterium]|nr:M56 family metallopeptidase [Actinomycetota bacterium]
MTISLAIMLGAAMVGVLLPPRLDALRSTGIGATTLISCWVMSILGVVLAGMAAVMLLLLPDHGVPGRLVAAVSTCWVAVRHGVSPGVEEISGLLGLLLLMVIAGRLVIVGRRLTARRARSYQERVAVLRLVARAEEGSPAILWLAHDRPVAFSLSGRPSYLVATEGLSRCLTETQLEAVLEHERAHLRSRHHLLLGFVDVLALALPLVPLFRAAPNALRELAEWAADAAAARRFGVEVVRAALMRVGYGGEPEAALAFGRDAIETRLQQLASSAEPPGRVHRCAAGCLAAGAPFSPFLTAAVLFAVSSSLFCSG